MSKAYVKINVLAGKEKAVRELLIAQDGVLSADLTSGDQDIIAVVEAPSYDAILDLVLNRIRAIEGVTGTVTNLVLV